MSDEQPISRRDALKAATALGAVVVMARAVSAMEEHSPSTPVEQLSLEQIAEKVRDFRKSLFQREGGVEFSTTLTAVNDPFEDFAFKNSLSTQTAILWPKVFIKGGGRFTDSPEQYSRVSVYDFLEHRTVAYDNFEGVIFPGRHLFSSGYASLFRYLHLAEGSQDYQFGKEAPGLTTVPECFRTAAYRVVGTQDVDKVRCVVVEAENHDKIWLAIDKGYLVHRREMRHDTENIMRIMTQIDEYQEVCPGLFLPAKMTCTEYGWPEDKPERRGKPIFTLRLHVDLPQCGKVDPQIMEIRFPEGLRVTDLTREQ